MNEQVNEKIINQIQVEMCRDWCKKNGHPFPEEPKPTPRQELKWVSDYMFRLTEAHRDHGVS